MLPLKDEEENACAHEGNARRELSRADTGSPYRKRTFPPQMHA